MNLKEIRKLFRDMSGRNDLVNGDLSNNGADFYINEAIRWLDRRIDIARAGGTVNYFVPARNWVSQFPLARAIRQVLVNDEPLCMHTPGLLMREIHRVGGELMNAMPTMCAVLASRADEQINSGYAITPTDYREFFKNLAVVSDTPDEVNTLILNTRVPEPGAMISILGLFYQTPLIDDNDTNYWSRSHPMILVNSAIRQTYVTSGNKAMLDIFNDAIDKDIMAFGLDRVEETIFGSGQMRSNF